MSRPVLDRHKFTNLIVVTSDFHAERAGFLFKREFSDKSVKISKNLTHLPLTNLKYRGPDTVEKLNCNDTLRKVLVGKFLK